MKEEMVEVIKNGKNIEQGGDNVSEYLIQILCKQIKNMI